MNKDKRKFYIYYTIFFLVINFLILSVFWVNDKTLIWKLDGEPVLIPEFYYLGHCIRDMAKNIFLNREMGISIYDFSLGLGKNIFEYLGNWYLEPLSFLSVFAKYDYVEYIYSICTIIRLYFVGVSFSVLCFWKKCEYMPTLISTVVYTFSFYVIYVGLRFPLFLAPMIYFPFFIIAVDILLEKNDFRLLTLLVFLSIWTHYYFFVISTVFLAVYFIVEFVSQDKKCLSIFVRKVFLVIISYLWGCAMATFLLLFNIPTFLNSNRTTAVINTPSLLLYDSHFYKQLWKYISFPSNRYEIGYELYVAFIPLVLFACIFLILRREKKENDLKIFLLLFCFVLTIPALSFAVCGFSNINNRWSYVLVIFMHYIFCYMMPKMHNMDKRKLLILSIYPMSYFISIYFIEKPVDKQMHVAYIFILVSYVLIVITNRLSKRIFYVTILTMAFINTIFIGIMFTNKYGYYNEYADRDTVETCIGDLGEYFIDRNSRSDFYRIENLETDRAKLGSSVCMGYNSVSDYSNVMNKDIYRLLVDVESSGLQENIMYYDMDGRTVLDQINAVRYVCVRKRQNSFIPYNYTKIDEMIDSNGELYEIYENNNPVSIGYVANSIMSLDDYSKLDAIEKQGSLIEGAVVDLDTIESRIKKYHNPILNGKLAKINNIWIENGEINGNEINVFENGATVHIEYEGQPGSESYLRLKNVDISQIGLFDTTWYVINAMEQSKTVFLMSNNNYYNPHVDNKIVNLGYSKEAQSICSIYIPFPGTYEWDGVEISTVSMEKYDTLVSEDNRSYMKAVSVENDCVSGRIDVIEQGILCLSIPYDKNWKIYIDGNETNVLKTNQAYIGAEISKGEHLVEIKYEVNGLIIAAFISGCSIMMFVLYSFGIYKKIGRCKNCENSNNGRRKGNQDIFRSK